MKMANGTLIFLKNNNKTKEELLEFFGNNNLYTSYDLFVENDNAHPSEFYQNDTQISIDYLYKMFSPSFSKYSERSLLLKPSKNLEQLNSDKFKIVSKGCIKPLYYNDKLNGWITSVVNKEILTQQKNIFENNTQDKLLRNCKLSNYKNGLLLNVDNKKSIYKKNPKYFMNGFWNKKLNGYIFSKKEQEHLINAGAHLAF